MNKIVLFIFFLTIVILLESLAQYFISKSISNYNISFIIISIFLYGLIALFYTLSLKNYNNIGIANGIWNITSTLVISLVVGYFFLNEKFTILQIIGFIVITIGGILIIPFNNKNINIKKK